mgnify:FL=1
MPIQQALLITDTQPAVPGQAEWTTPGTYNWTVPAGVTEVSILCVGGGGGGGSASPQDADGGGGLSLIHI